MRSKFERNSALNGGAIYCATGCTLTIEDTTFVDNQVPTSGSPLRGSALYSFGAVNVSRCTFVGQRGVRGVIYSDNADNVLRVVDCAFRNTTATTVAGVIGAVVFSSNAVQLVNVTIDGVVAVGDAGSAFDVLVTSRCQASHCARPPALTTSRAQSSRRQAAHGREFELGRRPSRARAPRHALNAASSRVADDQRAGNFVQRRPLHCARADVCAEHHVDGWKKRASLSFVLSLR